MKFQFSQCGLKCVFLQLLCHQRPYLPFQNHQIASMLQMRSQCPLEVLKMMSIQPDSETWHVKWEGLLHTHSARGGRPQAGQEVMWEEHSGSRRVTSRSGAENERAPRGQVRSPHKWKVRRDFTGVFECHLVTVKRGREGPALSHCASGCLADASSLCSGVLRHQENWKF